MRPRAVRTAATALAWLALTSAPASSAKPAATTLDADTLAGAFNEICIRSGFEATAVQAAFMRRGWTARLVQRPTAAAPFSHWVLPFGDVSVGYRIVHGAELRISSCTLAVRANSAPEPTRLIRSVQTRIAPARFDEARPDGSAYRLEARIRDEEGEQARVTIAGDRVPFAGKGSIALEPGMLIDYTSAIGAYARTIFELAPPGN